MQGNHVKEYPELMRINSDQVEVRSDKRYAEIGHLSTFLRGRRHLVIEEKLDGSQMAIGWKGGDLYIQGRRSHISLNENRPAYAGVIDWATDHDGIAELRGYLVFGEWLKVQHHVVYDALPDWFIAFDVYDLKNKRYLGLKQKHKILIRAGITAAPILHEGRINLEMLEELTIEQTSNFGSEPMEGCVVKDYQKQDFLKMVVREFDEMDSHWTSPDRQRFNEIVASSEVREQMQKIIDSRGFSGNVLIDTEDVRFVLRRFAPKGHQKELQIANITVYEEGTGTWKELWLVILDVAKQNEYDRIKVELVYNEKWREWFERPGSGWEKVYEGTGETIPSYWYSV